MPHLYTPLFMCVKLMPSYQNLVHVVLEQMVISDPRNLKFRLRVRVHFVLYYELAVLVNILQIFHKLVNQPVLQIELLALLK